MTKRILVLCAATLALLGGTILFGSKEASAHGYVTQPISRVANAKANGFGWGPGEISSHPEIISTPAGVEGLTSLFDSGELYGKLGSAGLKAYSLLDVQTSSRWVKSTISTGLTDFKWHHTATHKTNRYRYYMTKQGWDQNAPLSWENMELIGIVGNPIGEDYPAGEGFIPAVDETHKIEVPSDRSGYHVIHSLWDINDTSNSFSQVIDVTIK